jgi:hypothetical protein
MPGEAPGTTVGCTPSLEELVMDGFPVSIVTRQNLTDAEARLDIPGQRR